MAIAFGPVEAPEPAIDSGPRLLITRTWSAPDDSEEEPSGGYISISPSSVSAFEGDAGTSVFTFTVTRTGDTSEYANLYWYVSGAGADADDFSGGAFPSGSVAFSPGESSQTISVPVNGDIEVEANEGFTVHLVEYYEYYDEYYEYYEGYEDYEGYEVATASGTILNDDVPITVSLEPATVSQVEGNTGAQIYSFTVTRSGDASAVSSVNWTVQGVGANAANGADFLAGILPSGSLTFASGETSKTIEVAVSGDLVVEPDEQFQVSLTGAVNAVIDQGSALGVIINDDQPSTVVVAPVATSQVEGNVGSQIHSFTVTRSGDVDTVASVNWVVEGWGFSPANALDFQGGVLPSGNLTFAAGETSKTIEVAVSGDFIVEPDEQFQVRLTDAVNTAIGQGGALGVIVNDDAQMIAPFIAPQVQVQVEGDEGQQTVFAFTAMRFGDVSQAAVGQWALSFPPGGSGASSSDFLATSGVVQFAPGAATAQVLVTVVGDAAPESAEIFDVLVSMPGVPAVIGRGLIINDDLVPLSGGGEMRVEAVGHYDLYGWAGM